MRKDIPNRPNRRGRDAGPTRRDILRTMLEEFWGIDLNKPRGRRRRQLSNEPINESINVGEGTSLPRIPELDVPVETIAMGGWYSAKEYSAAECLDGMRSG